MNWTSIQTTAIALADFITLLFKVLLSIVEAIYRACTASEVNVSSEIVLVTGAAQGIGKELVTQYGQLGATVVCVDLNKELNEETVASLKKQGIVAHAYTCDVTNRNQLLELAEQIKQEVGPVSILVNNAGIMPCKRLLDHSEGDIRKLFEVNIISHFWTLDAFLPSMIERNHGHIVALSSIAGLEGYPNVVPYNATKFAVRGLMEGLAEECRIEGRNIQFTTIYPFMVDTGLCKKPRIRFDFLLGMLSPSNVAASIIRAQRRGLREISIPRYVRPFTFFLRLLPVAANEAFHDFMNTGLEACDTPSN